MCNYLHLDSEPITPQGAGYKYFVRLDTGQLLSWFMEYEYKVNNGKVVWDHKKYKEKGDGFCFFIEDPDDLTSIHAYSGELVCRKIWYHNGLGQHWDHKMPINRRTAICKAFSLHPETVALGEFL